MHGFGERVVLLSVMPRRLTAVRPKSSVGSSPFTGWGGPLSPARRMASLLHDIQHHSVTIAAPLPLDSGQVLPSVTIAYQSYGALSADKSNAVLICHALTGDQDVASDHPATGKP